ncbi:TetR/AcrR family transcriptional regulator [Metabacillus malikii]|uniref:AcrR family transcriptional regulator n=1 Tax=Metabacillus malikii TaxID=1504265 RepID=A0ABT9ZDJ2_9BACI|nr:TetR/AcrR family transcriptional regulator [Metabacillus malikii]MDQ0230335.1 AcrR family transcriptional regulator [Metabacillus malikii]
MLKKQLIMEKALELFAEQGFEATSVQQITEHCGISKGAFYLSFKSKDELIFALIDHFVTEITTTIDYTVKNGEYSNLLYDFFYSSFHLIDKHSNFAKIFIIEQTHTMNKEIISKLHYYNELHERIILLLVEKRFGDAVKQSKYDLVYCIKGFIQTYSGLLIFSKVPLDLDALTRSLVEKTEILAKHMSLPFITSEFSMIGKDISKNELISVIEQSIDEIEDSIGKESLALLKEEIISPSLKPAIIHGLIENIRSYPQCRWTSILLRNYFGLFNTRS